MTCRTQLHPAPGVSRVAFSHQWPSILCGVPNPVPFSRTWPLQHPGLHTFQKEIPQLHPPTFTAPHIPSSSRCSPLTPTYEFLINPLPPRAPHEHSSLYLEHIQCIHGPCSTQRTETSDLAPALQELQDGANISGNTNLSSNSQPLPRHCLGKLRLREVNSCARVQIARALSVYMSPAFFTQCRELPLPLESSGSGDLEGSGTLCEDMFGRCCQLDFWSALGDYLGLSLLSCRLG